MTKRTIDSIKESEVVWCKTPIEAEEFCKLLHEAGKKWRNGESYIENTSNHMYIGEICYNVNGSQYGYKSFYEKEYKTITPATEFLQEEKEESEEDFPLLRTSNSPEKWAKREPEEPSLYDLVKEVRDKIMNTPVQVKSVPYQLCPTCHGKKVTFEQYPNPVCSICNGEGIIAQKIVE